MELELASIKLGGDFDSLSGETLSELEVGNETFITALGGPSTTNSNIEKVADAPMTVWTGSLSTDIPGGYLANGDSITSMEGIANSPGYTLGNGVPNQVEYGPSPSQVSNNVGVGSIHLECEFGAGVDVLSSPSVNIVRPTFEFTFIVPSIIAQQLQLPEGAGFFIGRENDRAGSFATGNLGSKVHSALLTHIGRDDVRNHIAGLRILLGYESDNTGPGIFESTTDGYSFASFDLKNADSTHGYDHIGSIKSNLASLR